MADEKIENLAARFKAQQPVRAKVLSVDLEKGRLTLGMRPSLFEGEGEEEEGQGKESGSEDLDEGGWLGRAVLGWLS